MNDKKPDETPLDAEDIQEEPSVDETSEIEEEKDIETQLAEALESAVQYKDGWMRARAELDNYRKRADRDRGQREIEIKETVLSELLPVLDDYDLAIMNIPDRLANEDWVSGIFMIHKKMMTQLEKMGLEEIEAAGQIFDPNLHEAAMQAESNEHEANTVINVLRKGYMIGNKVIHPALVRVAM